MKRSERTAEFYKEAMNVARAAQANWHNLDDALKAKTIATLQEALKGKDGWPRVFVNSETGRIYQPHNDPERSAVFSDTPRYLLVRGGEGGGKSVAGIMKTLGRIRRGMSGLMCCVAPETMIAGMPIGDRKHPGPVQTLFGPSWATAGIPEGRTDLFRVRTTTGEEVVVTKSHRFLTPTGWRQLQRLRVGALIAADGTSCARYFQEREPDSRDRCRRGFHSHDGRASPWELFLQTTQQRSAWQYAHRCDVASGSSRTGHSCTDNSAYQVPQGVVALGRHLPFGACERWCNSACAYLEGSQRASRPDSQHRWHPNSNPLDLDTGASRQNAPSLGERESCNFQRASLPQRYPREASLDRNAQQCDLSFAHPYSYYTTKVRWVQIESITFQRFGEFWDLSVPSVQHYVAQGLFHHNSPNLPHLRRSLWPEFRRWCPWDRVVKKHQRFGKLDWEPHEPWNIVFRNDAVLHCTGIENPGSLEGPNINFAHFDEARHHPDGKALKVLDGRVRIPGPRGQPPQIFLTTTPALNWLYEYFGPLQVDVHGNTDDPYAAFKADARDIILLTKDNEVNLFDGFAQSRAQTLTEKEARVLLEAQWEDLTDGQPFLPDITWWDNCKEVLPPLDPREPLVLAVDAATGRTATSSDCFAITGITRHPDRNRSKDSIAVRYAKIWQARAGRKIDYRGTPLEPGPERELLRLCGYELSADGVPVPLPAGGHNVLTVVYDPTELHDMSTRLYRAGVAWFQEFSQGARRNEADRQLLEMIQQQRLAHDGNPELRQHIRNADRKTDDSGHRLRIVKRVESQKIDLAVALSMGAYETMRLNL